MLLSMTEDLSAVADTQALMPLAARMRPTALDEYIGQTHLLAAGKPLREAIINGQLHSMIFWGPPGTGKTSLATMFAHIAGAHFQRLSAVLAGVKDIRQVVSMAEIARQSTGRQTILFIDEVHRFNKSQQDVFLPYIEDGTITLIGATTENPSFELNNALLSRCRVYALKLLTDDEIVALLQRALRDSRRGLGQLSLQCDDNHLVLIAQVADGDARRALNMLEIASDLAVDNGGGQVTITSSVLEEVLGGYCKRFDKGGDIFYRQISALHKSVRGSSPDAALYWLLRMLDGGCDPLYIARRVVRMAVEDIGNADPRALHMALDAWDVQERLGSPEGELAIAQVVLYLASAPKSNAVYRAFRRAQADIKDLPAYDVPLHLCNASTRLMKSLHYGADYRYPHDEEDAFAAGENYFPERLADRRYYFPVSRGLESKIKAKLDDLRRRNQVSHRQRYDCFD